MQKIILQIEGMTGTPCEAQISEAVRRAGAVRDVRSSYQNGTAEVIAEQTADEQLLRAAVEAGGYRVSAVWYEPHEPNGFFAKLGGEQHAV